MDYTCWPSHLLVTAARPKLCKPQLGAVHQGELWAAESSPMRAKTSPATGLQGPAVLGGNGELHPRLPMLRALTELSAELQTQAANCRLTSPISRGRFVRPEVYTIQETLFRNRT